VGKENGKEGASDGSFLGGGEREGGVAGLARRHVERGSGGGASARSASGPRNRGGSGWCYQRWQRMLMVGAGWSTGEGGGARATWGD
jgi:hypothetical protein